MKVNPAESAHLWCSLKPEPVYAVASLTRLTDIHHQGLAPGRMSNRGENGKEDPAS
jgi:hypothetical protein